jgi:hypothetical protein
MKSNYHHERDANNGMSDSSNSGYRGIQGDKLELHVEKSNNEISSQTSLLLLIIYSGQISFDPTQHTRPLYQ